MNDDYKVLNDIISVYNNVKMVSFGEDVTKLSPGEKIAKDRQDLINYMLENGYSHEEVQMVVGVTDRQLAMRVLDEYNVAVESGVTKSDAPDFYHVAAQPGAGKSKAVEEIQKTANGVPLISEMDKYRTKHPNIVEIKEMIAKKYPNDLEKQGKEFVKFTSLYADMHELAFVSYMIVNGYSVVKETTGKNSRGVSGLISALKALNPNMRASIACLAVAQEVSIDGTITRGDAMNLLTSMFVEDLNKRGIDIKPIGRGNVPREFSEVVCKQIPVAMEELLRSGLIDGEFIIATRSSIVSKTKGSDCVLNAEALSQELFDRISGEKSKQEEQEHFSKKKMDEAEALVYFMQGTQDKFVEIFMRPTVTWLGENEEAFVFYQQESGLADKTKVAEWVIKNKMISTFFEKTYSSGEKEMEEQFNAFASSVESNNLETIKAFVAQNRGVEQIQIFDDVSVSGKKM